MLRRLSNAAHTNSNPSSAASSLDSNNTNNNNNNSGINNSSGSSSSNFSTMNRGGPGIGARPSMTPADGQGHRRNKSLAEAMLSFSKDKDSDISENPVGPRSTSLSVAGTTDSISTTPMTASSQSQSPSQSSSNANTGPPPSPLSPSSSNYNYDNYPPASPGWGSSTLSKSTGRPQAKPQNEHWERLAVILKQLFQKTTVSESIEFRNDLVRLSAKIDGDSFVYQKCKDMLTKGMIILREQFKDVLDHRSFIDRFAHTWSLFYNHILPEIQATFQPVLYDSAFDLSIRKLCLVAWRDHVVLNTVVKQKLEDAIANRTKMSSSMLQMLLMSQSVQDNSQNEQIIFGILSSMSVPFLYPDGSDPGGSSRLSHRSISESSLKTLALNPNAPPSQEKSPFSRHTMGRSSRKSYASDRDLDITTLAKEL